MRLHFASADYPARVAKRLKRSLESTVSPFSLSRCQNVVAEMFGYRDWRELYKATAVAPPSQWDNEVGSEVAGLRRDQYVRVLRAEGFDAETSRRIVDEIGPSRRRVEKADADVGFILGSRFASETFDLSELKVGLDDLAKMPGWARFREALKQAIRSTARWSARTTAAIEDDTQIVAFFDGMRSSGSGAAWDAASLLVVGYVATLQAPEKPSGRVVAHAIRDVVSFGVPDRLERCLSEFNSKELAVLVGIGVQALGPLLVASAASEGKFGLATADGRGIEVGVVHDWKGWTAPAVSALTRWPESWNLHKAEDIAGNIDIEARKARDTQVKSVLDRSDEDFLSLVSYFRRMPRGGPHADVMEAFEPIRQDSVVRELLLLRMPEADAVRSVGFAITRRTFDPAGTLQIVIEAYGVHFRYQGLPVRRTLAALVGWQIQEEVRSGALASYDRSELDIWVEAGSNCDDGMIELLHQSIDNCVEHLEVAEPFGDLGLTLETRRGTPMAPRPVRSLRHFSSTDIVNCDKLVAAMNLFDSQASASFGGRSDDEAHLAYFKGTATIFFKRRGWLLDFGNDDRPRTEVSAFDDKLLSSFGPEIFWVLREVGERSGFNDDFVVVNLGPGVLAVFRGAGWRNRSWHRVGGLPALLTSVTYRDTGIEALRRRFWDRFAGLSRQVDETGSSRTSTFGNGFGL